MNLQTRVVEFWLDEEKHIVNAFKSLTFREGNTLFALYFLDSTIQTYRCVKY